MTIPITIQTALQADVLIKGSKLRELLEGSTSQDFLDFLANHCNILIPGTGLTEEDLPTAIQAARISDATQLQKIASAYLKDGINCSVEYDVQRLQDDFHQHVEEYVTDWKENDVEGLIRQLDREQCTTLLEAVSIQVTDDDSIEALREAVQANLEDETISADDIQSA